MLVWKEREEDKKGGRKERSGGKDLERINRY